MANCYVTLGKSLLSGSSLLLLQWRHDYPPPRVAAKVKGACLMCHSQHEGALTSTAMQARTEACIWPGPVLNSAVWGLQDTGMMAQDAEINNPSHLTAHTEFTKKPLSLLSGTLHPLSALGSVLHSTQSDTGARYPTIQDPHKPSLLTCP